MARPRKFNEEEALDAAMQLFWEQGFEATSMTDIQEQLGMGRQSVYNTFGDKRTLFLSALRRYSTLQEANRTGLSDFDSGRDDIRAWFDRIAIFASPEGARPSCFLVNTISELGSEDAEANDICRSNRDGLTRQFQRALDNEVVRGSLAGVDTEQLALSLVAQTYGILLLGKNGASRESLRSVADVAMTLLTRAGSE